MNRLSGIPSLIARAVLASTWFWSLGAGTALLAQGAAPNDDAAVARSAEDTAPPPDRARRSRDRPRLTDADARAARAATATAEDADAHTPPQTSAETGETKIVCKNVKVLGTKISRRTCGTPEQWAAQERKTTGDAQETMRQVRDRSAIVAPQPDNPLGPGGL